MDDPFVDAIENLSRHHRAHEEFYAQRPREQAVQLQRHSRALHALADRWERVSVASGDALNPYEGADDLNAPEAVQLDGILFMEGEGEPAEILGIKADLRAAADTSIATGEWLSEAMAGTWAAAAALLGYADLADLLGERHRIIANDWQAAGMSAVAGHALRRAAEILDTVDFTPAGLRADLGDRRTAPKVLHSVAELVDHAADLLSDSAGLVHDNERRWRVFHQRIVELRDR